MMGALAHAARAGGATIVGVTAEVLTETEGSDHASDRLIMTADLGSRKATMIENADHFVILPGGLGTLDELFEVWTTGPQLMLHHKTIVLVNEDGFYDGLLKWLREVSDLGLIHPRLLDTLTVVHTAEEAIDQVA